MSYKGLFKPKHPNKYKGDPSNIVFRSSWELKFMNYLDAHEDVITWSSEEFCIPYRSPVDGAVHRYFPDFWLKQRKLDGTIETVVVEIKPKKQTMPPEPQKKRTKRYINEVMTWGVNSAKWQAAQKFCESKNWKFAIFTENHLGISLNG